MKILVLSPHRDDAAFSLSLSIHRWLALGHKVTILNVFTRSLYAPFSDADTVHENDRLAYVSALRRREDEEFVKQMPGATMVDLNLKDAPIRLHCDSSVVCDLDVNPEDTAIPKIRKAISAMADAHLSFSALALPLGLGHHVDHCVTRDASIPPAADLPCAFYEDLPYAARDGVRIDLSRFCAEIDARWHEALCPVLCHSDHARPAERKRHLALLYASQIDSALADTIASFSHRYQGAERLWANRAWLAVASAEKLSVQQPDPEAEPLPA